MTIDELKEELSQIGLIEVFSNNETIFTLFINDIEVKYKIMNVLKIVEDTIQDKPFVEVIKNTDTFILIVLKNNNEIN